LFAINIEVKPVQLAKALSTIVRLEFGKCIEVKPVHPQKV
jgi:hypothetical protein